MSLLKVAFELLPSIFKTIDKAVPDRDLARQLKNDIQSQMIENQGKELEAARDIIVAEAKGDSWLQRNWRPILMLSIVGIVVNNYIIFPYVKLFGLNAVMLDLPEELFTLMTVGVGGYVISRGAEKVAKTRYNNN